MKTYLILLTVVFISMNSFAQGEIVVEGKSSVQVTPEQLNFQVIISVKDKNYKQCANLSLDKIEDIKKAFLSKEIDEDMIKTASFSIREKRERNFQTNKDIFNGYESNIQLIIKTKSDYSKNDQIFEIIKSNASSNFTLHFSLSPEQTEMVKEKLIELAVNDAKKKARIISKSAGISLSGIKKIQYGEPRTIARFSGSNDLLTSENISIRGASTTMSEALNPTDIEMRTSIVIEWEIEE